MVLTSKVLKTPIFCVFDQILSFLYLTHIVKLFKKSFTNL